jgi:hypothetical protein
MSLSLFLDSGAHGLYTEHVIKKKHEDEGGARSLRVKLNKRFRERGYGWYETKEFWDYCDTYAEFLKTEKAQHIDVYANVDVIFNPYLTWKAQQYLEKEHGLHPIPVIHYGTHVKWIHRYIEAGHKYIALGGLGQEARINDYVKWANKAFSVICDQPSRLPKCKVHGFAISSHTLLTQYPWWSCDSAKWVKQSAYGHILMPPWDHTKKKWDYTRPFRNVRVSGCESKSKLHIAIDATIKKGSQDLFMQYIEEKGFRLGKSEFRYETIDGKRKQSEEIIVEDGLCNNVTQRSTLNALYFIDLSDSLPKWPWPFTRFEKHNYGFKLTEQSKNEE